MNKYGNINSFISIFGSGHFNAREVRGKSISVTTVVPRPLSNDPRFTQCIYRYSRASKRFVEVYTLYTRKRERDFLRCCYNSLAI